MITNFCWWYNNGEIRRVRNSQKKKKKKKIDAAKRPMKIWDVNVDNMVVSKLVKAKTNSRYLVVYLDKAKTISFGNA